MNDASDRWVELREILDGPAEQIAFRALVAALDTWPGDDAEQALQFAEQRLAEWPDEVREAPWSWVAALAEGKTKPTWRLVRGYAATANHLSVRRVGFDRITDRPEARSFSELRLNSYGDEARAEYEAFERVADSLSGLKRISVDPSWHKHPETLEQLPVWTRVEELHVDKLVGWGFHYRPIRFAPRVESGDRLRRVSMQADDLIDLWGRVALTRLTHATVVVSSVDEAERLARRPELSSVETIELAFRCGRNGRCSMFPFPGNVIDEDDDAAESFFRAADLSRVRRLKLSGYALGYWGREGMGPRGLAALAASGALARLEQLSLSHLPLGSEGPRILAEALPQAGLKALTLCDVWLDDEGAATLARSGRLGHLEELVLDANRMTAVGSSRLAEVEMPRLRSLNLSGPRCNPYYWHVGDQPIGARGATAWAESPNADSIETLVLQGCALRDEGLTALARSKRFGSLRTLTATNDAFSEVAVAELARSEVWRTLRHLDLSETRFDDACARALARVASAPALRTLGIGYSSIGSAGIAALADWPVLANLWKLDLHDHVLGDEDLIAFAESPFVGKLLELDLEQDCWNSRQRNFGDSAADALAAAAMPRLDAIYCGCIDEYHGAFYAEGFSRRGIDALKRAPRRPEVAASLSFRPMPDDDEPDSSPERSAEEIDADRRERDFRSSPRTLRELPGGC